MKGHGVSQDNAKGYSKPSRKGDIVRELGEGYDVKLVREERCWRMDTNADHWKSWLKDRIATPLGKPGALTLCSVPKTLDHLSLAKHLTAEREVQEYVPGVGIRIRWERMNRNNHHGDVFYMCGALAARAGAGGVIVGVGRGRGRSQQLGVRSQNGRRWFIS